MSERPTRACLLAIFAVDRELEEEMRMLQYRPFQQRPKASVWRWLEYSESAPEMDRPASRLSTAIKHAARIDDQGPAATFTALAERGLVHLDWRDSQLSGQRMSYLRLTPTGRKLAQSWTGVTAYKAPPAGTLKESHWRALAKAYAAGDEGLDGTYGDYGRIGWNTWHRLRDFKWGALVEERSMYGLHSYRLHITDTGRWQYEREWARYHALYPDTEAAEFNPRTVAQEL